MDGLACCNVERIPAQTIFAPGFRNFFHAAVSTIPRASTRVIVVITRFITLGMRSHKKWLFYISVVLKFGCSNYERTCIKECPVSERAREVIDWPSTWAWHMLYHTFGLFWQNTLQEVTLQELTFLLSYFSVRTCTCHITKALEPK